jgi:hypothetical protein
MGLRNCRDADLDLFQIGFKKFYAEQYLKDLVALTSRINWQISPLHELALAT